MKSKSSAKRKFQTGNAWLKDWTKRVYGKSRDAKSELKQAKKKNKRTRATAYTYLRGLDHQLSMIGVDVSVFLPDGKSTPSERLKRGEKRYFADVPCQNDRPAGEEPRTKRRRCIVRAADGAKRLEVQSFVGGLRPHLTLCGDQGGSGLPAWNFIFQHLRMRGSFYSDPFHRVARDWKLTLQQTGMWGYVQEGQVLLTWLHGPWKSEMWFTNMVDAMDEYLRECGQAEAMGVSLLDQFVQVRFEPERREHSQISLQPSARLTTRADPLVSAH